MFWPFTTATAGLLYFQAASTDSTLADLFRPSNQPSAAWSFSWAPTASVTADLASANVLGAAARNFSTLTM